MAYVFCDCPTENSGGNGSVVNTSTLITYANRQTSNAFNIYSNAIMRIGEKYTINTQLTLITSNSVSSPPAFNYGLPKITISGFSNTYISDYNSPYTSNTPHQATLYKSYTDVAIHSTLQVAFSFVNNVTTSGPVGVSGGVVIIGDYYTAPPPPLNPPTSLVYTNSNQTIVDGNSITVMVPSNGGGAITLYVIKSGDTLPTGLSLNSSTGKISGSISGVAVYTFAITGSNADGSTNSSNNTINVTESPPSKLDYMNIGQTYDLFVPITPLIPTYSGGTPTAYSIYIGPLPNGLNLDTVFGYITGIPDTPGVFIFQIEASNSGGSTLSPVYSIPVGV